MLDLQLIVLTVGNVLRQMAAIQKRLARNVACYICVSLSSLLMKFHMALGDDTEIMLAIRNANLQLRLYF